MAWPLTWTIIVGTLPGVFIGAIIRIKYLPDPRAFKFFVGFVLLYIGGRLLYELSSRVTSKKAKIRALDEKFKQRADKIKVEQKARIASGLSPEAVVKTVRFSFTRYQYEFYGETFSFNTIGLLFLTFVVGIIGGTYGIGGGAIIAPFLIAVFHLPVYTIAGAALMGTFLTSIVGVIFYTLIAPLYADTGLSIAPDWPLGILFGIGGFAGMYCGARFQKFVPQKFIKLVLGMVITSLAFRYLVHYFL